MQKSARICLDYQVKQCSHALLGYVGRKNAARLGTSPIAYLIELSYVENLTNFSSIVNVKQRHGSVFLCCVSAELGNSVGLCSLLERYNGQGRPKNQLAKSFLFCPYGPLEQHESEFNFKITALCLYLTAFLSCLHERDFVVCSFQSITAHSRKKIVAC